MSKWDEELEDLEVEDELDDMEDDFDADELGIDPEGEEEDELERDRRYQ